MLRCWTFIARRKPKQSILFTCSFELKKIIMEACSHITSSSPRPPPPPQNFKWWLCGIWRLCAIALLGAGTSNFWFTIAESNHGNSFTNFGCISFTKKTLDPARQEERKNFHAVVKTLQVTYSFREMMHVSIILYHNFLVLWSWLQAFAMIPGFHLCQSHNSHNSVLISKLTREERNKELSPI